VSVIIKGLSDKGAERIGAKAANLVKLSGLVNVPGFFCIPGSFFDSVLSGRKILIREILEAVNFEEAESVGKASRQIKEILAGIHLPEDFKTELSDYLHTHFKDTKSFSVRSSSMLEDGEAHSFAGQFDTYLNVGLTELAGAILKCFASLYSENALKYAHISGIRLTDCRMSVIVQEMVDADISGVIFTSNPQGLLNEAVITNGRGTGNLVVEDKVPVTTYYYNKTDEKTYYETNGQSPVLPNEFVKKLMDISSELCRAFGKQLDIEYAVKADEIYILQARPITTLDDSKLTVLDNSNIVESYPGISLPLTYSFIKEAYKGVFKNAAYIVTGSHTTTNRCDGVFENMLGFVNGRVYYKLSNWYTLIKLLPMSKKIIPVWQDMMGVQNKELCYTEVNISFLQTIRTYISFIFAFLGTPKRMRRLDRDFEAVSRHFHQRYNEHLSGDELAALYGQLREKLFDKWGITLLNDTYAFVFTGLLKSVFRKSGLENYEEETIKYISGISNIESMKPVRELIRIAGLVLKEGRTEALKALDTDATVVNFLNQPGAIQAEIRRYMEAYGDRSLEELKLESKTFRVAPVLLIGKILEYTEDPVRLEKMAASFEGGMAPDISKQFGLFKRKYIKFLSKRAISGISSRETSRLNRSRIYGMIRSIFMSLADVFKREGLIDDAADIFYLETDEIFGLVGGKAIDLKKIIQARKKEFALFDKLPAYSRLIFAGDEWNKRHKNVNSADVSADFDTITGTPCSGGIVTGEVAVINTPGDARNVKDKILVTKMTDPGWVFLLTAAKGVIAEKGSLLSHTAIISRELNIPAIVGVTDAARLLKDGDIITMDGNNGVIERVG